jgi:triacylglycerol lipase
MRRLLVTAALLLLFARPIAMAAPPTKNPVLLLHGIKDDARKMEPMARHLRAQGWEAHTFSYRPSWGQKGLDELAAQVATEADRLFPRGQKFDLVAFSMGGLVSRYYLQRLGGVERVDRFITLSTPHHGTWLAHLIPNAGCRQMRPGSEFLRELNASADCLARVRFTSLWTPFDTIILPARSSELPGVRCEKMPVLLHPLMVVQPSVLRRVAAVLAEER